MPDKHVLEIPTIVQIWEKPNGPCPPFFATFQHCHLGSKNLVLGLWQRLGTSMDWSLAIHPYGPPLKVGNDMYL